MLVLRFWLLMICGSYMFSIFDHFICSHTTWCCMLYSQITTWRRRGMCRRSWTSSTCRTWAIPRRGSVHVDRHRHHPYPWERSGSAAACTSGGCDLHARATMTSMVHWQSDHSPCLCTLATIPWFDNTLIQPSRQTNRRIGFALHREYNHELFHFCKVWRWSRSACAEAFQVN